MATADIITPISSTDIRARFHTARPLKLVAALLAMLASLSILWIVLNVKYEPTHDGSVVILRLDPQPSLGNDADTETLLSALDPTDTPETHAADLAIDVYPPTPGAKPSDSMADLSPAGAQSQPVQQDKVGPLRIEAYPDLIEHGKNGALPIIAASGLSSLDAYARPFPLADKRPRISIVIGGLGLSKRATMDALERLPSEISFAFAPYGSDLQSWVDSAKLKGHEVLLELPMEPFDYPDNNPGPFTLLTQNDVTENTLRLNWLLSRFTGYVGVSNYLGGKLTSQPEPLLPILDEISRRGLMYLDDGSSQRSMVMDLADQLSLPATQAAMTVDLRASRASIDDALLDLETVARQKGQAIGLGYAYPVTVDRLASWARTLEQKGLALAPVSAQLREAH